ncbi:hypothetical protein VNI00_018728, partial [Paramarasmius palmivorus]
TFFALPNAPPFCIPASRIVSTQKLYADIAFNLTLGNAETHVTNTDQDRIHAAEAAVQQVAYRLNSDGFVPNADYNFVTLPNFYGVLANYNIETKLQFLQESFINYLDVHRHRSLVHDERMRKHTELGYVLARAYLAFTGADHLLDFAKSIWDDVNQYTISESDINTGKIPTKNVNIPQHCDGGETLRGATFQPIMGTSTIGLLIEGLSLLASLPSGVEAELESMLPKLIMQVFNETTHGWPSPGGILPGLTGCGAECVSYDSPYVDVKFDLFSRDVALARGMAVAYKQARSLSSDLRDAIKAFLGVQVSVPLQNTLLLLIWSQYNAVRKRAYLGSDVYDGSWTGSQSLSSFDLMNQSSAIQILVDGISLFENGHRSLPIPALAGSIVGGVLFVAISVLAIILILRWRTHQRSLLETKSHISSDPLQFDPQYVVVPFQWEPQTKLPLDTTRSKARTQTISEGLLTPSAPIMDDAPTEKQPHEEVPPPPDVRTISDEHNTLNNSNIVPFADHATSEVPVVHGPSFPDMIRMMYQQMWQPDTTESPPDYRSQS